VGFGHTALQSYVAIVVLRVTASSALPPSHRFTPLERKINKMTNEKSYPGFLAQAWSGKINTGLDASCVMLQCVNRDYQADADKGVEAINIIAPKKVKASNYAGTISSYETVDTEGQKLKLDQSVYFGFQVPDIEEAQSNTSIIDTLTAQAKKSIEESIDAYLFGHYTEAAAANVTGSAEDPVLLDSVSVYAKFVALAKKLKLSGAMTSSDKGWVVVHPDVEELLLLSDEFSAPSATGDNTLSTGSIGRIAGLDVFVSSNVGKVSDKYVVLAGTQRAITYASQLTKIETIRSQSSFNSIVRGLYTFGALTMNPEAMAVMTCRTA